MDDVQNVPFLPDGKLDAASWEKLFEQLRSCDGLMEEKRSRAEAEGKKLRYLASLEGDEAKVGLHEIDATHPAFHLGGTDNIILLYTDRYVEQPMVIKGAGAGPEVTASGVMSDIMRVINL